MCILQNTSKSIIVIVFKNTAQEIMYSCTLYTLKSILQDYLLFTFLLLSLKYTFKCAIRNLRITYVFWQFTHTFHI